MSARSFPLHPVCWSAAFALWAAPAMAHPHVFVTTEVEIVVTDGQVQGVRLDWEYDDFFSFVLLSDLGIDQDGDMILTDDEQGLLFDAVLDWPADYAGDLEVTRDGATLPLGPRAEAGVAFTEGRVVESHFRPLDPAQAVPVTVAVYDPTFYIAYEIAGMPRIVDADGAEVTDCTVELLKADLDAAYAEVAALTGREAQDFDAEEDFPEVGASFADRVIVTCAG